MPHALLASPRRFVASLRRRPALTVGALAGLLALGGCGGPPPPKVLRLEAMELRFKPPAEVPAGPVRIRLVNHDPVWHEASLLRFTDTTRTLEDYIAAARAGDEYPSFAEDVGGVGFLAPGDSAEVLVELRAGRYAVICWHSDHVMQGMGATFTVTGEVPPDAFHAGGAEVRLADGVIPALTPARGRQVLHVTNAGPAEHELAILRLEPGKTYVDFMAWRAAGETGTPPAYSVAGTAALAPGHEIWVIVPWAAGRYVMVCLLEDSEGHYHADLGERQEFEVAQ